MYQGNSKKKSLPTNEVDFSGAKVEALLKYTFSLFYIVLYIFNNYLLTFNFKLKKMYIVKRKKIKNH